MSEPSGAFNWPGVIAINVVRILQDIARQHRDHVGIAGDHARRRELANSRQRGGGSGFATDAALADDGFRVRNLLLGHALHHAVRGLDFELSFRPRHGIADLDRRRQRLRMLRRR